MSQRGSIGKEAILQALFDSDDEGDLVQSEDDDLDRSLSLEDDEDPWGPVNNEGEEEQVDDEPAHDQQPVLQEGEDNHDNFSLSHSLSPEDANDKGEEEQVEDEHANDQQPVLQEGEDNHENFSLSLSLSPEDANDEGEEEQVEDEPATDEQPVLQEGEEVPEKADDPDRQPVLQDGEDNHDKEQDEAFSVQPVLKNYAMSKAVKRISGEYAQEPPAKRGNVNIGYPAADPVTSPDPVLENDLEDEFCHDVDYVKNNLLVAPFFGHLSVDDHANDNAWNTVVGANGATPGHHPVAGEDQALAEQPVNGEFVQKPPGHQLVLGENQALPSKCAQKPTGHHPVPGEDQALGDPTGPEESSQKPPGHYPVPGEDQALGEQPVRVQPGTSTQPTAKKQLHFLGAGPQTADPVASTDRDKDLACK